MKASKFIKAIQELKIGSQPGLDIRHDLTFKDLTSIKVGAAPLDTRIANTEEALAQVISHLRRLCIPYFVLGKGTNVLAPDKGMDGVVVKLGGELKRVMETEEGLLAYGGATISSLLQYALKNALAGLEFLVGIPGTVGGAIRMNAGAYGREVKDVLAWAEVLDPVEGKRKWDIHELGLAYRCSKLKRDQVVVSALFMVKPSRKEAVFNEMKRLLHRRIQSQPSNVPTMGSVFKNPEGDYAGRLIEEVGLKGHRIGGAEVSMKHGNFIINTGAASSKEIIQLIEEIKKKVKEKTGKGLELEIVIIPESLT